MTSAIAPLRPVALVIWRLIASSGHPLCVEHIQTDPGVSAACRKAHASCLRTLGRLCTLGHLVNDGAALHCRAFWWGPTCIVPAGEPDYPRFRTAADVTRALPRTRIDPVARPLEALRLPLRPGCQDYLAHPSRRGNHLFYRDGRVTTLPAVALPQPAGEPA